MTSKNKYDVLIIGGGPAGLASANYCLHEGVSFIVVESGKDLKQRSHNNAGEVVKGVGGAGLFSDGKLSYYPSAHSLYSLPSHLILKKAYAWFHNLVSDIVIDPPEYPTTRMPDIWHQTQINKHFSEKEYHSIYLDDKEMKEIVDRLFKPIAHRVKSETEIIAIAKQDRGYLVTSRSVNEGIEKSLLVESIIYCGGRFGPLSLSKIYSDLPTIYRRFEYGVRIQQKKNDFFTSKFPSIDTKLIANDDNNNSQWRTFCCCQEGRVLKSEFDGVYTYSGSRWKSEKANVGFNVRIKDFDHYKSNAGEISSLLRGKIDSFNMPLEDFINGNNILGKKLTSLLIEGINRLSSEFELGDAEVYGPCIEGVGFYPNLTGELALKNSNNFYIAGDSTGIFRGLLPALISGYYVAERTCKNRIVNVKSTNEKVSIKHSSVEHMPVIFTAQSKRYFYCRDAICEYVLKANALPINPFRVFDYFLSDRVDRDLVRQGNNHLINLCDELWVFGPIADGVLFEIVYSLNIQRPIRFFKLGTRSNEIKPITKISDISFEQEIHLAGHKKVDLLKEIEMALHQIHSENEQLDLLF